MHGVFCRGVSDRNNAPPTIFVLNLLQSPVTIRLLVRHNVSGGAAGVAEVRSATDVLSGQRVSLSKGMRLSVRAVRVLRPHART